MSGDSEIVKCPSCEHDKFEDVGFTWIGYKGVILCKNNTDSVNIHMNYDDTETEVYHDDFHHLYWECLSCGDIFKIVTDGDNKKILTATNEQNFSLDKKYIKNRVTALQDKKQELDNIVDTLELKIKKLEKETVELEKFIAISNKPSKKSILKGLRNIRKK